MYHVFPHTADVGLRIEAAEMEALFEDAGRALFSLIVTNVADVKRETDVEFEVEADNLEYLFFDFLSELLFIFERDKLLLGDFRVSVDSHRLKAKASGECVDRQRHHLAHEVKAITYHGLKVEQTSEGWMAEVIVDI